MSPIEMITVIVCSVAIGASVASVLTFVALGTLRKRMILRGSGAAVVPEETASVLALLGKAFDDRVPDNDREVLKALVVRYSQTSLTSVLSDDVERSYLFEALADPSQAPWKSEERQRGVRSE